MKLDATVVETPGVGVNHLLVAINIEKEGFSKFWH